MFSVISAVIKAMNSAITLTYVSGLCVHATVVCVFAAPVCVGVYVGGINFLKKAHRISLKQIAGRPIENEACKKKKEKDYSENNSIAVVTH